MENRWEMGNSKWDYRIQRRSCKDVSTFSISAVNGAAGCVRLVGKA
jgi:hypothetical protein